MERERETETELQRERQRERKKKRKEEKKEKRRRSVAFPRHPALLWRWAIAREMYTGHETVTGLGQRAAGGKWCTVVN